MSLAPLDLVSADAWHRVTLTIFALRLSFVEAIALDSLTRGSGRQAMILARRRGRASLGEQGAQCVGKDYKVEPVAVTSGVFPPKVSVFSGREASGKPTAIDPEFEFRRGPYCHHHHAAADTSPKAVVSRISQVGIADGR